MADVPFLGCKISLISKCDIRYEGILYCVDPKESTISLSKVKSYGTESRVADPNAYVPPKNDIYDVIIFRASDVKDLRVDAPEPPGLTDPAIISARQSSSNGVIDMRSEGINNGSLPTSSGPSQQQHQQQSQQSHKPLLPFLPSGSNQKEQGAQERSHPVNYSSAVANAQRRARTENQKDIGNRKTESSFARDGGPRRGGDGADRRDDRRDDRRIDKRDDRRDDRRDERRDDRRNDRRNDDRRFYERRDYDGGRRGDGRPPMRVNRGGYDRNHVNPRYNNANNSRRGPSSRDDRDSKGGPPNRRVGPTGGRRGRSGERTGAPRDTRKGAPLKFEGEYDFDEANKIFLELEAKLKDMKIKEGGKEDAEGSADRDNSKSSNDQSESGSGYDSDDQTNNRDGDSKEGRVGGSVSGEFYDKSKSFFDNISCEASERVQGKVNKPDWRKERQTNAETFGISANYRRGGYRGRSYRPHGSSYRV